MRLIKRIRMVIDSDPTKTLSDVADEMGKSSGSIAGAVFHAGFKFKDLKDARILELMEFERRHKAAE